ncbi:MAG: hypothetical protein IKV16_05575, partial [Clostridia bacterium]|nr:hypothetical protein [Clostridia bacterium]
SFTTKILPIFIELKIYPEEIDELFLEAEKCIIDSESYSVLSIYSLYRKAITVLGSERSGSLLYSLALNSINEKRESTAKKYEQDGNLYKRDLIRYEGLYTDLTRLGAENFSTALTISSLILSTASSVNETVTENAFSVSDAELLYILDRQGDILTKKSPTEEQWQTFGAIISELIPKKSDTLISSSAYALKNYYHKIELDGSDGRDALDVILENPELYPLVYRSGYIATAMKVMPKLFSLYTALAKNLRNEAKFSLESTLDEKEAAIFSALFICEEEIRALDLALTSFATADFDTLRANVQAYSDPQRLESFLSNTSTLTADELILSVKNISECDTGAQAGEIKALLTSYLFNISPYLSFVIFG